MRFARLARAMTLASSSSSMATSSSLTMTSSSSSRATTSTRSRAIASSTSHAPTTTTRRRRDAIARASDRTIFYSFVSSLALTRATALASNGDVSAHARALATRAILRETSNADGERRDDASDVGSDQSDRTSNASDVGRDVNDWPWANDDGPRAMTARALIARLRAIDDADDRARGRRRSRSNGYFDMASVKRKRKKAMNKHKHRKRKRRDRFQNKT